MIALGVGIDYALLIISRFRGERRRGEDVREATLNALNTAGRSVLFAGTTVVIALLGMLLLGIGFLNGPAVAAALAVFCTMIGSLTLLPALLGTFGHRVKLGKIKPPDAEPHGFARWARIIEKRPRIFALVTTVVLAARRRPRCSGCSSAPATRATTPPARRPGSPTTSCPRASARASTARCSSSPSCPRPVTAPRSTSSRPP